MKIILDGSCCYDKVNAGYKYFWNMIPRLAAQPGVQVEVIPSPAGLFDEGLPPEVYVRKRLKLSGGWLPPGKLRSSLSQVKRTLEGFLQKSSKLPRSVPAPATTTAEKRLFQSWFYTSPTETIPQIQMILDVIPERMSSKIEFGNVATLLERKRRAIREATHMISISETTKRDLCEYYKISPDRVDTVHLGIDLDYFGQHTSVHEREYVLLRNEIDRPYFLQVGGRANHKNFDRLLEAFARGKFQKDFLLVSTGESFTDEERQRISDLGISDFVRQIRWPSEDELRIFYQGATSLVYPSLYEGFGIPPIEAMGSGLPVVASTGGSIPEICGDAVLYFDPLEIDSMVESMRRMLDTETAKKYRAKGAVHCQQYNWDRCARLTREVYDRVLA